jgi:hypothetical protein
MVLTEDLKISNYHQDYKMEEAHHRDDRLREK